MAADLFGEAPVFRAAGLSLSQLDRLSFPRSFAMATEIAEAHDWLCRHGTLLAERLYPVVGRCGQHLKPRLVGLRRAFHQGKGPRDGDWTADLAQAAGPELAAD